MIWTTETAGNLSVDYNFANGAWAQEKSLLRVSIANTTSPKSVDIEWGEVASYVTDKNGQMLVDVSFAVRGEYAIGNTNGLITISCGEDVVDIPFVILGLRNPENMLIPASASGYLGQFATVVPPTKWLQPLFGLTDLVEVYISNEITGDDGSISLDYVLDGSTDSVILPAGLSCNVVPTGATGIVLYYVNEKTVPLISVRKVYSRSELLCDRQYAAVEWVSRAGSTKRHTWEVVKVTDLVNGATGYMTVDDSYHQSKGQEVSLVLRLDGLSRYDYWYYSDIITSSDVRVAVLENEADFGDETRVEVVTNKIVQPDVNDTFTLEVEIKYKRYDEI